MNNFFDYLMSYISFLENTSDEVIETGITKEKERIFDRINEKYLILKKKNKNQLMNQKNNFYKNGCIKYFDINTKEFTEIEQLALVHLFLEIFLNKRISLKKIFRRNYCNNIIWQEINDILDEMYFEFEKKIVNNDTPEVLLVIL